MRGVCPFTENLTGQMASHTYNTFEYQKVGFCDHTAGGFYRTLRDVGFWAGRGVSVHFGIARDGRACQLVNIFHMAYGQGSINSPSWPPYFGLMQRQNPNLYLISTEHEDAVTVNGRTVFVPDAVWTPEMYETDLRIKRWCIEEAAREGMDLMQFGLDSLAGHHMFDAVNRVNCPGPAWKREYRQRLFSDLTGEVKEDEEEDMVVVHKHNTGAPDRHKAYLVQGKVWRHIPDLETFEAIKATGIPVYWPDARAYEMMVKGATVEG